jgi:hypothetical protein
MTATNFNKYPLLQPTGGINFATGKRFDSFSVPSVYSAALGSTAPLVKPVVTAKTPTIVPPAVVTGDGTFSTKPAVPSLQESLATIFEFEQAREPFERQRRITAAEDQQRIDDAGLLRNYELIRKAARESKELDFYLGAQGLAARQSSPDALQARMQSAATTAATPALALAAQQDAATRFARSYPV